MFNQSTFFQKTTVHIVRSIISKDNINDDDIIHKINEYLALTPIYVQSLFTVSLIYVNILSVIKKYSLFYNLSAEASGSILSDMEHSKLFFNRAIVMMVKLISTLVYFDNDENAKTIGYNHLAHCK